jgi:hypothetical protein
LAGTTETGAGRAGALLAVAGAAALAACGPGDNDPGPGGVTVGEARALDEAAEMLDRQQLPEQALTVSGEAEEETDGEPADAGEE